MAGDLLLEKLMFDQRTTLIDAGGVQTLSIFHSDRTYDKWNGGLSVKIASRTATRDGLPPHSYITFQGNLSETYKKDQILRLRLDNVLKKMTRQPFLSQKASLDGWPGDGPLSAVVMLENAIRRGSIIVEFYSMDGAHLKDAFPHWNMVPE